MKIEKLYDYLMNDNDCIYSLIPNKNKTLQNYYTSESFLLDNLIIDVTNYNEYSNNYNVLDNLIDVTNYNEYSNNYNEYLSYYINENYHEDVNLPIHLNFSKERKNVFTFVIDFFYIHEQHESFNIIADNFTIEVNCIGDMIIINRSEFLLEYRIGTVLKLDFGIN